MRSRTVLCAVAKVFSASAAAQQAAVRLYAAGSLRSAMTDIAQAFTASGATAVETTCCASGLLRERIESGEPADVFASADMGNGQALAGSGRAATPVDFARNTLCALAAPGVDVTTATLLDRMLDPGIKLGTSMPKADPSGDYAWTLFEKADKQRPGARGTSCGCRRSTCE
jgi:ABC-type molybdate transport system substrate-binding protein